MAPAREVELVRMYVEQKRSICDISRAMGMPISTVRFALKRRDVLRGRAEALRMAADEGRLGSGLRGRSRQFSPEWKENMRLARVAWAEQHAAGVSHKKSGYVVFTRGEHKGRGVHSVVAEEGLGRRLRPDELAHHVDENKSNNDPLNLQPMTRAEHSRLHAFENLNMRRRNARGQFE